MFLKKTKIVKCNTCRCLIEKEDALLVEHHTYLEFYYDYTEIYYCETHSKPYSITHLYSNGRHFYQELEVDINGIPVGYVKKKK